MSKVYEIVTDRIIKLLEAGTIPWRQPWANAQPARNIITKQEYRGFNWLLLNSIGYSNPYFLTFKQAKELDGHVRKGEHGFPVVFWKQWETPETDDDGNPITVPVLRYYTVFNVAQCELPAGAVPPVPVEQREFSPIRAAEAISEGMPQCPEIRHQEQRAYYHTVEDYVNMPPAESFEDASGYYSTLFHELSHATGHQSRLNRKSDISGPHYFGSPLYAREELVAEMGAAFLSAHVGIDSATIENSAAYIRSWLGKLRYDCKLVVIAAAQAQRAADYILNRQD